MQINEKVIHVPFGYYFGVFLNLTCNLNCDYCVQKISLPRQSVASYSLVSGKDWVEALNAITNRTKKRFLRAAKKKKISITGGEPTLHPDFVYIVNNLDRNWNITVTSNFSSPFFGADAASLKQIKKRSRLKFNGSFHFLYAPIDKFIENTLNIKKAGLSVHTLFIVGHPSYIKEIKEYKKRLLEIHPLVKVQRFFGYYQEDLYPKAGQEYDIEYEQQDGIYNYKEYQEGFAQKKRQLIHCRMNKVLFAPNGDIYNCHYKLYTGHRDRLGNLFEKDVEIVVPQDYFLCNDYGFCNPCDSESHLFKRPNSEEEFNISKAT